VPLSILSGRKTQEIEEIPIRLKNEGILSVLYGVSDKIPYLWYGDVVLTIKD
jgi:hypothetical protein